VFSRWPVEQKVKKQNWKRACWWWANGRFRGVEEGGWVVVYRTSEPPPKGTPSTDTPAGRKGAERGLVREVDWEKGQN